MLDGIKKKLDSLSSMTDEDIDAMAALLKTLRGAPQAPPAEKEETPATIPAKLTESVWYYIGKDVLSVPEQIPNTQPFFSEKLLILYVDY